MGKNKVVIIGSGPAGYTAAIYTSRAGLDTVLLEGQAPGGQLMITTDIDNFPGFSKGIKGTTLMAEMRAQAERFGTKMIGDTAEKADFSKRPFEVTVGSKTYLADALIIATGASARWLGLDSEKKLFGKGVSACATCDGFFFKDKSVVVVGGGDTAVEEAIFLTHFAGEVYVVHRRSELRAGRYMQEQANKNKRIKFIWNTVVLDIFDPAKGVVTGVKLKDVKTGRSRVHPCNGVFVAIGHRPASEIFTGQLVMDENGYIKTEPGRTGTSVPGVFAAGDVADPIYRQAITAAGSGSMAAIEAERYLASL